MVTYSTVFCYLFQSVYLTLQPLSTCVGGLDMSPFRSSLTKGLSFDFFSSPYLDISVQEVPAPSYDGALSIYIGAGFPIRTPTD